ncbi:MAG: TIGR03808 family TAT-translocated repetitive protein [Hyphomicrobiaceae bacterium]
MSLQPDRRTLVALLASAGSLVPAAAMAAPRQRSAGPLKTAAAHELGLVPDAAADQSAVLQAAVDQAALRGVVLALAPGRYRVRGVELRAGSHVVGSPRTVISASGGPALVGNGANGVRLEKLRIEGPGATGSPGAGGLVELTGSEHIGLHDVSLADASGDGFLITRCSGRVDGCRIERVRSAGLKSVDAAGLAIQGNTVADCGDNGIIVWRTEVGEDGTIVADNRIERIGAASGGSGQNGNGVNVFRAGGVRVAGNRITDCAYSAVRANAASNVQITANTVARIGEVALYAEFGFEGALIAQNVVDGAAAGIAVTNFNEGGRLAVVQGNLVRNLKRREHEPVDKRGEGISVEADAAVSGNTIEGAPTAGIVIGWGRYMRNVAATGNVIRACRVGVMITRDPAAGTCLVAQNVIAGARDGAVRLMELGRLTGEDLARAGSRSERLVVAGNAVA